MAEMFIANRKQQTKHEKSIIEENLLQVTPKANAFDAMAPKKGEELFTDFAHSHIKMNSKKQNNPSDIDSDPITNNRHNPGYYLLLDLIQDHVK